jgi:hypothetical protein
MNALPFAHSFQNHSMYEYHFFFALVFGILNSRDRIPLEEGICEIAGDANGIDGAVMSLRFLVTLFPGFWCCSSWSS